MSIKLNGKRVKHTVKKMIIFICLSYSYFIYDLIEDY